VICNSGTAFSARVDGRRLSFEEVGIYNGVFVMQDHQTKTYWSHYTGEGIRGPLRNATLDWHQLHRLNWSTLRELHPEATVPVRSALKFKERPPVARRAETLGETLPKKFIPTLPTDLSRVLPRHEHGVGLAVGPERRFYPLERLYADTVLADQLGGVEVVVFVHDGSASAAAFSRCVEGRTLTFASDNGVIVDRETGTHWDETGRGANGPLAGKQLTHVRAIVTDWYGWASYFEDSTVYAPPSPPEAAPPPSQRVPPR
jgi:hypothetical protein